MFSPPKIKKKQLHFQPLNLGLNNPINSGSLASKVILYKLWTNNHPDRMVLPSTVPVASCNTVGLTLVSSSSENEQDGCEILSRTKKVIPNFRDFFQVFFIIWGIMGARNFFGTQTSSESLGNAPINLTNYDWPHFVLLTFFYLLKDWATILHLNINCCNIVELINQIQCGIP